jgi:hypothetical protein
MKMVEFPFRTFPEVFVGLKGRNGAVRECIALVDPCSEYCIMPKVDGYALGYPEAANDDPITPADNTLTYTSFDGYGKAAMIGMAEVSFGGLSFPNIEFLALDLPQVTRFDVVIGRSLLRFTKLEVDYSTHMLRIEEAKGGATG